MKLNRSFYAMLVAEDIAWLEKQPRTLERDHVIGIVRDSAALYYDAEELALLMTDARPDEVRATELGQRLVARILGITQVPPR